MIKNKEDLFACLELATCEFELPNGKKVMLRELDLASRQLLKKGGWDDQAEFQANVLIAGTDFFTEDDKPAIKAKSSKVIGLMCEKILLMSGLGDDEEGKEKKP